jgi:hypothetical protein
VLQIAPAAEREIDPVVGPEPAIVPVVEPELAIARVAVREPAIVLVEELELAIAPVAVRELAIVLVEELELAIAPVAAELELARVEVVPELGLLPDQLAGVLKTKSVTAAHHRGLPLLAVVDLAAAAGTTRVPAATEVAAVWAVAE